MLLNLFIDLFCFETRPRVFIQDFNASCTTFVLGEVFSHGRLDLERKFSFYFPVGYILFIFPGFFFIFLFETSMSNENEFLDCVNNCMLFLFPFQYQVTWRRNETRRSFARPDGRIKVATKTTSAGKTRKAT